MNPHPHTDDLTSPVKAAIANIEETEWEPIDYPEGGEAQVTETAFCASKKGKGRRVRMVVRRTRLTDPAQAQLWPDWRYHAFATNTQLAPIEADTYHRAHARTELAIRDLKQHAGLSHCPSGNFFANAAWLSCATLAHNLYRWIEHHTRPMGRLTNGNTVRTRLFTLPGRIVNHGRKLILRLPHPMAMGRHLPHHPHRRPRPPPTLLNPPTPNQTNQQKPLPQVPHVPKAPYPTEHPQQTGPTPTEPHPPPQIHPPPPHNPTTPPSPHSNTPKRWSRLRSRRYAASSSEPFRRAPGQ